MRILGWIRVGDKAACGGTVIEGNNRMTYDGIPYSYQDARVDCSQACVIAEATSFYRLPNGKRVPHHGHRTSGGCPLHSSMNDLCGYATDDAATVPVQFISDGSGGWLPCNHASAYDLAFLIKDERTGEPLANVPYRIALNDGRSIEGRTDTAGRTEVIHSDHPEHATLTAPYYGSVSTAIDPGVEPDTCHC